MAVARFLCLAAAVVVASATGEYERVPDIGAGSKMHKLADFSITALRRTCAASNSLSCSRLAGAQFKQVRRAEQQVVSGMNYRIEAETDQGQLVLEVYEQPWTQTLVLKSAELTLPPSGASFAIVSLGNALDKELELDADAFAATLNSKPQCVGGQKWNECGSQCTKTCEEPSPICMMMCKPRCECPREKPIFKDGLCIALADCPVAEPVTKPVTKPVAAPIAKPAATEEDCVPNMFAPCPRIYQPVCGNGKTYANPCLAKADCQFKYTNGPCKKTTPASVAPTFLIGGAPVTEATKGGHYTGSDAMLDAFQPPPDEEAEEDVEELSKVTVEREAKVKSGEQAAAAMLLATIAVAVVVIAVVLVSRTGRHTRGSANEATPMAAADAQKDLGVRMDADVQVKTVHP